MFVVCLGLALPFSTKALHIDDTMYVHIARQILDDPLRPFSGSINWYQRTERAWNVSTSPPGYSYWLATWMRFGVTSETG